MIDIGQAPPMDAEPVATEPVVPEPVAAEPVAAESVAAEPVAAEIGRASDQEDNKQSAVEAFEQELNEDITNMYRKKIQRVTDDIEKTEKIHQEQMDEVNSMKLQQQQLSLQLVQAEQKMAERAAMIETCHSKLQVLRTSMHNMGRSI